MTLGKVYRLDMVGTVAIVCGTHGGWMASGIGNLTLNLSLV